MTLCIICSCINQKESDKKTDSSLFRDSHCEDTEITIASDVLVGSVSCVYSSPDCFRNSLACVEELFVKPSDGLFDKPFLSNNNLEESKLQKTVSVKPKSKKIANKFLGSHLDNRKHTIGAVHKSKFSKSWSHSGSGGGLSSIYNSQRRNTRINFEVVRPVELIFRTDKLPSQVIDLLVYLAREGIAVPNLFRKSGAAQDVRKILRQLKDGHRVNWTNYNFHTLANVAKRFLLSIENGILGQVAELSMLNAGANKNSDYAREKMHEIISTLSLSVQCLLVLLFGTWFRMTYHMHINHMSLEAIAKSVAGSVFLNACASLKCVDQATKLMQFLIESFPRSSLFGPQLLHYFTQQTKTCLYGQERYAYSIVVPHSLLVPRIQYIRDFVRRLKKESDRHSFDLLRDIVSKEEFDRAAIIDYDEFQLLSADTDDAKLNDIIKVNKSTPALAAQSKSLNNDRKTSKPAQRPISLILTHDRVVHSTPTSASSMKQIGCSFSEEPLYSHLISPESVANYENRLADRREKSPRYLRSLPRFSHPQTRSHLSFAHKAIKKQNQQTACCKTAGELYFYSNHFFEEEAVDDEDECDDDEEYDDDEDEDDDDDDEDDDAEEDSDELDMYEIEELLSQSYPLNPDLKLFADKSESTRHLLNSTNYVKQRARIASGSTCPSEIFQTSLIKPQPLQITNSQNSKPFQPNLCLVEDKEGEQQEEEEQNNIGATSPCHIIHKNIPQTNAKPHELDMQFDGDYRFQLVRNSQLLRMQKRNSWFLNQRESDCIDGSLDADKDIHESLVKDINQNEEKLIDRVDCKLTSTPTDSETSSTSAVKETVYFVVRRCYGPF